MRIQNFRLSANRDKTLSVTCSYLPGSDEMWETVKHPACFKQAERAEAFLIKVSAQRHNIDLKNWIFDGHICSPIQPTTQPIPFVVDPEFQ